MSNLLFIILFVFCGIDIFFIVRAICKGKRVFMQFIPSLGWLIAMVIPFMAQCYDLLPANINIQAFGILLVGSLLLLGDAIRIKPLVHQNTLETSTGVPKTIYHFFTCENVYLIAFLVLAVINLLSMDTIPLVYKLSHPAADSATLSVLRAQSTKMLDVPLVFNYLFEWASAFIAPAGIILSFHKKKRLKGFIFLALALTYSLLTMAKGPILLLAASLLLYYFLTIDFKVPRTALIVIAVIVCLFGARVTTFFVANPYSIFNLPDNTRFEDTSFTVNSRETAYPDNFSSEYKAYNSIMYRSVLALPTCTNSWYRYPAAHNDTFFGYSDLLPGTRTSENYVKPSQAVAQWDLHPKWPDAYPPYTYYNCGIDGDAYARGGVPALIICALLLCGLRILLKLLYIKDNILSKICYYLSIIQLGALLASISLQAMLLVRGMIGMLLLMLILVVLSKVHQKQITNKNLP